MGLDTVELIMAFEEQFDIVIPDNEAENLITPRQTSELIESKLNRGGRSRPRSEIDELVRAIIFDQLSVDESIYHPDAEYVRDFGAD